LHERNWWEPEKRGRLASVVDHKTGEIFVFTQGTWLLQDDRGQPMSEGWIIANYRLGYQMGARLTMESSRDDGQTWTTTDITDQFYTYPNAGLAWFIGGGIQLERGPYKGRLVIPARYFTGDWTGIDPSKHNVLYHHSAHGAVYDDGIGQVSQVLDEQAHNAVIYSDDDGTTWQWGGSSQGLVGEACIVELADGSIYMNNRIIIHGHWGIGRGVLVGTAVKRSQNLGFTRNLSKDGVMLRLPDIWSPPLTSWDASCFPIRRVLKALINATVVRSSLLPA
jgi:hypothetical protein